LGSYFDITRDEIRCTLTGSQFIFAGLATNSVESIKSFEKITKCWCEEAQTISERSWELLVPTIRAPKAEIILTMNPEHADDATYVRFIKNYRSLDDAILIEMNWCDNPFFPDILRGEMEAMKKTDFDKYQHIWMGEPNRRSNDRVFDQNRLHLMNFDIQADWTPLFGVDFGYASDPTVMVKAYFDKSNNALYIAQAVVKFHCELDLLPAFFDEIEDAKKYIIRADCSRPETINYLRRNSYTKMMGCHKWKGSVEDGIDYLRSLYDIYIHPKCSYVYHELRTLSYKTDKNTGDILPAIDADRRREIVLEGGDRLSLKDDVVDALRYAIEPLVLGQNGLINKAIELNKPASGVPESWEMQQMSRMMNPNVWLV